MAIHTASQRRPRSPTSVGDHPPRRPNRPSIGYQRTKSPGSNSTGRPSETNSEVSRLLLWWPNATAFRLPPATINELTATKASHAFCSPTDPNSLATEVAELKTTITELVTAVAPQLLEPVRNRADHRRAGIHRLVPPPPMPQRSRVRSASRRRTPPGLLWATHPSPTEQTRRPPTQPGHPHHRYHPHAGLPQNPRLHSQTNRPRKNHPRSPPLPKTVHRPTSLPTPPKPAPNRTSPTVPGNAVTPPQAQKPTPRQNSIWKT